MEKERKNLNRKETKANVKSPQITMFEAPENLLMPTGLDPNNIVTGNVKAFVVDISRVRKEALTKLSNEFCYRFNRRYLHEGIFGWLLYALMHSSTMRFADLT